VTTGWDDCVVTQRTRETTRTKYRREDVMKYALLGYDTDGSLEGLATEDKRALHSGHRALPDEVVATTASVSVVGHYRFRPPRLATTIRLGTDDVITSEGPAARASEALRALYLLESDDPDAVLDLASRLPAIRMGGTVEVWPLTEPDRDDPTTARHRSRPRRH
jgi:hypothetical protein